MPRRASRRCPNAGAPGRERGLHWSCHLCENRAKFGWAARGYSAEVRRVISKILNIPADRLAPESRLDELGAESLDVIEIVFELEEKFGITISFKQAATTAMLRRRAPPVTSNRSCRRSIARSATT